MKKVIIILTILIVLVIGAVLILSDKTIDGLTLKQDKMSIVASWNKEPRANYKVIISWDDREKEYKSTKNNISIPIKEIPKGYKVKVVCEPNLRALRFLPKKAEAEIETKKIEQKITVGDKKFDMVVGVGKILKVEALGKITYESTNPKILVVDKKGKIKPLSAGNVKIKIHAAEGGYFEEAEETLTVKVYPKELEAPKIKSAIAGEKFRITWTKVKYANKYIVYKSNKKVRATKKTSYNKCQEASTYYVEAIREMPHHTIHGKKTKINIPTFAEAAPKHKKEYNIKTLGKDSFKEIATVNGKGSAVVPQSFSLVKGKYVVSFASRSGNESYLIGYNEKGKRLREIKVDLGFANGSTYNPNTTTIYTVETHMKHKSDKCTFYNITNGDKGTFKLPGITSGIAYDESYHKYYLSKGPKLEIVDKKFKHEKSFKKIRYKNAQDIGASKGVAIVSVWTGSVNYIDLYRVRDGAYLGSYTIPFGEVESVGAVNKHLVVLFHNTEFNGTRGGKILITKEVIHLL